MIVAAGSAEDDEVSHVPCRGGLHPTREPSFGSGSVRGGTSASIPIHTGTTTSLESSSSPWCLCVSSIVFGYLAMPPLLMLHFFFLKILTSAVKSTKVRRDGSIDLLLHYLVCCGLCALASFAALTALMYAAENMLPPMSLSCPSASSPYALRAIAELECQRCSDAQVFEHPADDPKNYLPDCLYDVAVFKVGKSGFGDSKAASTSSFCSPAPDHAQSYLFPSFALGEAKNSAAFSCTSRL